MDHMPCYTAVVQTWHYGIGVDNNTWYVICSPAPPSETNTHTRKPDIRWRESNMSVRRHANVNLSGDDVCQQKYSSSDSWSLSPVGKTRNYVNANPSFIVLVPSDNAKRIRSISVGICFTVNTTSAASVRRTLQVVLILYCFFGVHKYLFRSFFTSGICKRCGAGCVTAQPYSQISPCNVCDRNPWYYFDCTSHIIVW